MDEYATTHSESTSWQLSESVGFASLKHLTSAPDTGFNEEQILAVILGLTKECSFAALWNYQSNALRYCVGEQLALTEDLSALFAQACDEFQATITSVNDAFVILALPLHQTSSGEKDVVIIGLATTASDSIAIAMQITQTAMAWFRLKRAGHELQRSRAQNAHLSFHLQLLVDLAEHRTFFESTLVLSSQLQSYLNSSRVSIGVQRNNGVHVLHIGGQATTSQKNRSVKLIANAMSEAQHQEHILITDDIEKAPVQHAHRTLNDDSGNVGCCSIPIFFQEKMLCIVLLEFKSKGAFQKIERSELEQIQDVLGPFLDLLKQKGLSLPSIQNLTPSSWHRIQKKLKLPAAVAMIAMFITGTFLIDGEFKVTASASLQADQQRAIVAPFDGYLSESPADSGQIWQTDSTLVSLDTTELELEQMKWESELAKLEVDKNIAASQLKRSQLPIIETKRQQALIQLSLLSKQIQQATIRAPYDAIILSSATENRIGDRVREGEELLRISPSGSIVADIQISDTAISDIKEGMTGVLFLKAYPDTPLSFTIEEIPQLASGGQGEAFFTVKSVLQTTNKNLSPGMEGVAQIYVRDEPIAKVWSKGFMDTVMIYKWRLGL